MRKVFQNHEVAHVWASRSQDQGRNSTESFYFVGDTIYSYGSHFPIATLVDYKGELLCFMTTQSYSVTTAKHISWVRSAIPHRATIIYVETPITRICDFGPAYLRKVADEKAKNFRDAVALISQPRIRQTTRDARKSEAIRLANQYNEFVERFKLRRKPIVAVDLEAESEAINARLAKARAAEERKKRKQQEERERETLAELEQWVNHKCAFRHQFARVPLRLRINGDEIETSHGASIPLSLAKGLYRRFQQAKAQGNFDGLNTEVGIYQADKVENDHFVIGCHQIPFSEIERLAGQLGYSEPLAVGA